MGNENNERKTSKTDRATVLIAAARIGCDPRTARKVLEHGWDAARNLVHQERAREVLAELDAVSPSEPPRSAA